MLGVHIFVIILNVDNQTQTCLISATIKTKNILKMNQEKCRTCIGARAIQHVLLSLK